MKILYMTWGEVPRMSSVYGGQVVQLVSELNKQKDIESCMLLAGVPFIHSGLFRERFEYFDVLAEVKRELGCDMVWRNLFVPPVGVYPKEWQLNLFVQPHMTYLRRFFERYKPDVVQCRSYLATYVAHQVRKQVARKFKIVFDSRSYMPDEAVIAGKWAMGSKDHLFWKSVEKDLLAESDVTTVVSEPMAELFKSLGAKRTELVYLNVGGENDILLNESMERSDSAVNFVYAGSLEPGGWHDPSELWGVFASIVKTNPKSRLHVITKTNHQALKDMLNDKSYAEIRDLIVFDSARSPKEVVQKLMKYDIALLPYRKPFGEFEEMLAEGVFATKTAEYLMAGLPVLVNKYCGGAKRYIEASGFGAAYEPGADFSNDVLSMLFEKSKLCREEIRLGAEKSFLVENNAARLRDIYSSLIKNPSIIKS